MRHSKRAALLLLGSTMVGCTSSRQAIETVSSGGDVALVRVGAVELKENMRRLWGDHVIWTRQYIVAAVANDPGASAASTRLLRNQEDIGNAIKPFYGEAPGNRLTALLKDHILIAVDLVTAAKAGDKTKVADADRRWHDNARDIADFLSGANPNWQRDALLMMLNEHLSLTTQEATARIEKRWADDARLFDQIFTQAMHMADQLAAGIVKQFPSKV
jgi:hypothetical protein